MTARAKIDEFARRFVGEGMFFAGVKAGSIQRLLRGGTPENLYPGMPLLRINQSSDEIFFVVSGSYEVRSRNPFATRIVDAIEVVNLSGAIAGRRASATLRAGPEGCSVIRVSGAAAMPVFKANPELFVRGWARAFSYAESAEQTLGIIAANDSVVKVAGALVRLCSDLQIATGSVLLEGWGPERLAKVCLIDPRNAARALNALASPRQLKGERAKRLNLKQGLVIRAPKKRKQIRIPDIAALQRWYEEVENTGAQPVDQFAFADRSA